MEKDFKYGLNVRGSFVRSFGTGPPIGHFLNGNDHRSRLKAPFNALANLPAFLAARNLEIRNLESLLSSQRHILRLETRISRSKLSRVYSSLNKFHDNVSKICATSSEKIPNPARSKMITATSSQIASSTSGWD